MNVERIKMTEKKVNRTLDCIGLYCPEPVFRTRQEIDRMKIGEILEVLADDPAAEADIKSLIRRIGQKLLKIEKKDDHTVFVIKKIQ